MLVTLVLRIMHDPFKKSTGKCGTTVVNMKFLYLNYYVMECIKMFQSSTLTRGGAVLHRLGI